MSRSYKKQLRMNWCCGSNTEFYRERNRQRRRHSKEQLNKIRKMHIDDFSDMYMDPKIPKKDTWREPTDGGFILDKSEYAKLKKEYENESNEISKPYVKRLLTYCQRHLKYLNKNKRLS